MFSDRPGTDILYYPEQCDDKEELTKTGHYVLLRRTTLLSQPENKTFILWVTIFAVFNIADVAMQFGNFRITVPLTVAILRKPLKCC